MKVLILNSGMGTRMGSYTNEKPKCMTEIGNNETILSRQLKLLSRYNIKEIVITTGYLEDVLIEYCQSLQLDYKYKFINNPRYRDTNYIYSIYLAKDHLDDDLIMMHGDLVFDEIVLEKVIEAEKSVMTISSTVPLPEKDFKAVIKNNFIEKIGIEFFEHAVSAQPLYKLYKKDWQHWLNEIKRLIEDDQVSCYAENAFNNVSDKCKVFPLDIEDKLCTEIDTPEDLNSVIKYLRG